MPACEDKVSDHGMKDRQTREEDETVRDDEVEGGGGLSSAGVVTAIYLGAFGSWSSAQCFMAWEGGRWDEEPICMPPRPQKRYWVMREAKSGNSQLVAFPEDRGLLPRDASGVLSLSVYYNIAAICSWRHALRTVQSLAGLSGLD